MTYTRREFMRSTALIPFLLQSINRSAESQPNKKANVVLIMADDLGYECLSCNGSADYKTPQLDHLAATGIRFTHCYVNPLCTPCRTSLMTGRYNYRHYQSFGHLNAKEITFAHMLKSAGYTTAATGKWQLGNGSQNDQSPAQAGFDEYCLWNLKLGEDHAINERYADANLIYHDRDTGAHAFKQFKGEYGPDVCKQYLFEFMDNAVEKDQPFFAYYPMILPHNPFVPTPDSPEWIDGDRHQKHNRFFKDMVETVDRIAGEVAQKLDDLGVREDTLLIFLGDNGTNRNLSSTLQDGTEVPGGKGLLQENGTHVPLIANCPGLIPEGQVNDDLVSVVDFLPTLAEYTQAAMPQPIDGVIDGISFLPQLKGESKQSRDWILIEYFEDRGGARAEGRYVRNKRWKLYDQGFSPLSGNEFHKVGQFFDLKNDPNEQLPVQPNTLQGNAKQTYQTFQQVLTNHSI